MAEASGYTNKEEIAKISNDLNFTKKEVLNALMGVPYFESNCHTMVNVRNGKMFVEIVDARTIDIMRRNETK